MSREHDRYRGVWWRWSWRDLRDHWAAVLSIAAVIAIGTGVYAGLGSTATWRRVSNDASFAELRTHDVRVELPPGAFVDAGTLSALLDEVPHAGWVDAAGERLVVESQVDASTATETILVAARVVGADFDRPDVVDDVWVSSGELAPGSVVLERKFAEYYALATSGTIELSGGATVEYSGLGVGPEEFYVTSPTGTVLAHADYATVYARLADVQAIVGRGDVVNDFVVTVTPGTDPEALVAELEDAIARTAGLGATVSTRDDIEAVRVLYDDIENDQQVWNILSALVLGAAALAAFNLISRIVEAQRREIGIGMALGAPRRLLALRPLLIGLQVGVIGTLAGVGVGVLLGRLMRDLMREVVPMPHWLMPFQFGVFARGAVFGLLPPLLAAAIPVWRAVRVEPIEAIRTGHLAAGSGRLGGWARRVRVPGSSVQQMPARNLLRAPRRTVLTAVGVGAAITALVTVLAMLDSFDAAIRRGADEVTKGDPDRVAVALDGFVPTDAPVVEAVRAASVVGTVDTTLRVPGTLTGPDDEAFDVVVELLDLDGAAWTPTIVAAVPDGPGSGVVLAEKAAADLGVDVGDVVALTHPQRTALGVEFTTTELPVAGIHPNPIRTFVYLDHGFAERFGLAGVTNALQVTPADGAERGELQRVLFGIDGVASAQPVARIGESFDEALEQFVGFLVITAGAVLVLALLIAFNSARISVEERRREHATMMAFGVELRRVVAIVVKEAVVIGLLATAVGTLAGTVVLQWMLDSLAQRTLPDIQIVRVVSMQTLATAVVVGVVSVSLAPLLLVGRIRRMDLPDTLRVME